MIRYVLAVALTVALVGLGLAAVEYGSAVHSEGELDTAVKTLDDTAVELFESSEPPVADERPAQRLLTLTLPGDGYTSDTADRFEFERAANEPLTHVTYRVAGRAEHVEHIDAPLQYAGESAFDLAGYTGEITLKLRLVEDRDGSPVVAVSLVNGGET